MVVVDVNRLTPFLSSNAQDAMFDVFSSLPTGQDSHSDSDSDSHSDFSKQTPFSKQRIQTNDLYSASTMYLHFPLSINTNALAKFSECLRRQIRFEWLIQCF